MFLGSSEIRARIEMVDQAMSGTKLSAQVIYGGEPVPKRKEGPQDCQDAVDVNQSINRYAVADGVSQSFFPAQWAKLLVKRFCHSKDLQNIELFQNRNWKDWLAPIRAEWLRQVSLLVPEESNPFTADLRNKLHQGAPGAATFVGLEIDLSDAKGPVWRAMLSGDSCLFRVRNGNVASFPLEKSSQFDYYPQCLLSVTEKQKHQPAFLQGDVRLGDVFILATDALAKWLLSRYEAGGQAWDEAWKNLQGVRVWEEFYSFVQQARKSHHGPMDDDDVTMMVITIRDTPAALTTWIDPPIETEIVPDSPGLPKPPDEPAPVERRNSPLTWYVAALCIVSVLVNMWLISGRLSKESHSSAIVQETNATVPDALVRLVDVGRKKPLIMVEKEAVVFSLKAGPGGNNDWRQIEAKAWAAPSCLTGECVQDSFE